MVWASEVKGTALSRKEGDGNESSRKKVGLRIREDSWLE